MKLLSTNSKLRRSGILSFGLPAYKSASGMITCPGAKDCIKGCYARQGFYVMPSVAKAQEARLALTLTDSFVSAMDSEIKKRKPTMVRIHDSGDFYSQKYLEKWLEIITRNPSVKFYAYTKMKPLFDSLELPANFTVIHSMGGKWSRSIDPKRDRHSAVFASKAALRHAGYADVTEFDHRAIGKNHRIGLVYHGHASRKWSAAS